MEQQKPVFDYKDCEVVFTDLIEISLRGDSVSIGLSILDKNDITKAKVSHRVFMTLGHFMAFANTCNEVASDINNRFSKLEKE